MKPSLDFIRGDPIFDKLTSMIRENFEGSEKLKSEYLKEIQEKKQ